MPKSKELEALDRIVKKYQDRHKAAWIRGRNFGKRISRSKSGTDYEATLCAGLLCALTDKEDSECSLLLMEWMFEKYWAVQLEPLLSKYEQVWRSLIKSGPVTWGDIDYTAKAESKDKMIVSLICHPSCADDNTFLFIYEPSPYKLGKFHVRRCWPRAKYYSWCEPKDRKGWHYLETASVAFYRRQNFALLYGDCRDLGYALTYEEFTRKIDRGYTMGDRVYSAIWNLYGLIDGVIG